MQKSIHALNELEAFTNILVFLCHPSQFHAMQKTKVAVKQHAPQNCQDLLASWTSLFTGFSIVINRLTLDHRDSSGPMFGMDFLQVLGKGRNAKLELPGLGVSMAYGPRCGVLLAGKLLRHKVGNWTGGDRICIARWFREGVLQAMGIEQPLLPKIDSIL